MRILVLWADDASPNLGVRALGRGTAALAHRVWPDAEIVYQNYGTRAPQLPFGQVRSLIRERATGARGMQNWLGGFDLAIDTRSGDSFADIYGLQRLAVMSTVAEFATQAGVPVVLGPQTIGPFGTRRGRMIARRSLHRAAVVMARDAESAAEASRLGRRVDVLTTDVVFALPEPELTTPRDVLFNISGLLWNRNPHVDHIKYRQTVRRIHDGLTASGREVTLLAHVLDSADADNDVPAIREFAAEHAPGAEILLPTTLDEVRSAVGSSTTVIASRMHACLNALSLGTPAIPLAYSRKFDPLLRSLEWNHTVDLRTVDNAAEAAMAALGDPALETDAGAVVTRAASSLKAAENALRAIR